jgi:type II secretion system protein I
MERITGVNALRIIKKTCPAPEEKDGFTLVEVLVTLAILAAVLPALLQAFASAARTQGLSDNRTTALYLLKYRMAEIEMDGYPDVGDESDEFGENTRYRWRSVVEDVDSEDVENIRRVQVTVTWIHRNRERSISMSTYIADRQMPQSQAQQPGGGR